MPSEPVGSISASFPEYPPVKSPARRDETFFLILLYL